MPTRQFLFTLFFLILARHAAALSFDPDHSDAEQRYIDIGISDQNRLLVVVYTERGENIRLISCRQATATERKYYEQRR